MRRFSALGVLLGGVVLTAAAAQPDATLAVVAGRAIAARDFSRVLLAMRGNDYATTLKTLTPDGRKQILDDLVGTRVFAQAARDAGLDREPDVAFDVEQAVAGVLARRYRETLRTQLAPTEREMREWYQAHRREFATLPRVKARHILVATVDDATAVLAALEAGEPFERLAETRSIDTQTRSRGGDLGWVPKGFMASTFDAALFSLEPGQVSDAIQTSLGYHVVRVDAIDDSTIPAYEAVRERIGERLIDERVEAAGHDLARTYGARIDTDALDRFGRPEGRP